MPDTSNVFAYDDIILKSPILSGDPESDSSNCSSILSSQRSSPDRTTDEFDNHPYVFSQGPCSKERREQRQEREVDKKRKFKMPMAKAHLDLSSPNQSSGEKPEVEEAELKRRRLARKAELARESRKRKNDRIEELQAKVLGFEQQYQSAKNCTVVPSNKASTSNDDSDNKQPKTDIVLATMHVDTRLSQAAKAISMTSITDASCAEVIQAFYGSFAARLQHARVLQEQAALAAQPCLFMSFVHWVLSQSDKFYTDPSGLWVSLFITDLGASQVQLDRLLALRASLDQNKKDQPLGLDDQKKSMESFLETFSPQQLVLFFQWVEKFGAVCIKIKL